MKSLFFRPLFSKTDITFCVPLPQNKYQMMIFKRRAIVALFYVEEAGFQIHFTIKEI